MALVVIISYLFSYQESNVTVNNNYVNYKGLDNYGAVGEPALPIEIRHLSVPGGKKVEGLKVTITDSVVITNTFIPVRVEPPKGDVEIPEPDSLPQLSPKKVVNYKFSIFRGLGILTIQVSPIRYDHGRLILYKKIEVEPAFGSSSVQVLNKMGSYGLLLTNEIYHRLTNSYPPLPPADGIDLLVVAPQQFSSVAERYADLKRKAGFLTQIVYLEDLLNNYSGYDPAAVIRKGICDLYQKQGFIFLTLIGDPAILPARKFHWEYQNCILGRDIPTDRYYSCLDGDWNFDRDYYFGEIEDSVDLFPDIFVGRLSISNEKKGHGYLDKLEIMQQRPDTTINNKIIFFCSSLFQSGDSRAAADSIINHIPDTLNPFIAILDDVTGNLNKRSAFDSIRAGFRIAFGFGHGNPTRFQYDGEYAERPDFDTLYNQKKAGLIYHITCSNGSFETDCIGEHLANNRYGGALNFVGPAWVSFLYPGTDFAEELVELLPDYPIGMSVQLATVPFIPRMNSDEIIRLISFEVNTLGDPTVAYPLKDHIPITQFSHPDSVLTGLYQIPVTYQPTGLARVAFLGGGCHKTIVSSGNSQLEIYADYAGDGILSLSRAGEPVICDTVRIVEPDYHLKVLDFDYRPGRPNPFEQGSLSVLVKNMGVLTSPPAQLNLSTTNPKVSILSGQVQILAVQPQDSIWSSPFIIRFTDLKEKDEVRFAVVTTTSFPEFYDTISLYIAEPIIERIKNLIRDKDGDGRIEPDEGFFLDILFSNLGSEDSDTIICLLSADSTYVQLTIDSLDLLPIQPDKNVILGHFAGQAKSNWYPEVPFRLTLDTVTFSFELEPPAPPTPRCAIPVENGIAIEWDLPLGGDVSGFFIYRENPDSNLIMLNGLPVTISQYTDTLGNNALYRYYITSVDTSGNESRRSTPISANLLPIHEGFPAPLSYYNFASPKMADLDPDYPGLEIIQGCWDGNLFSYHEDGGGGLLAKIDGPIWSTPAIGDVDADGELEIVVGTRINPASVWVLDRKGNPEPGFPIQVDGQILSSIAISDLDADLRLEMTLVTTSGNFYIIDDDGSVIFTRKLGGYHWGTPAIGDLDDDDQLEIVPPSGNDTVYVFESDGSIMAPFPVSVPDRFFYGPTLADLDGDSLLEIAIGLSPSGSDQILLLDDDGSVMAGWPKDFNQGNVDDYVAFADIDGDDNPEVVVDYWIETWTGGIAALNSNGSYLKGWPRLRGEGSSNPVIADIDGDRRPDVICGSAGRYLYGFQFNGNYSPGFPIQLGHTIYTTPAVGDVDLDGKLEVAVAALDWKLYLFDLLGDNHQGALIWPCFRGDLYNTGCYHKPEVEVSGDQKRLEGMLGIIPVPARAPLFLSYNTTSEMTFRVFDVIGRVVRNERVKGKGRFKIDLPAGVYFLQVESEERQLNKKIVLLK